MVVRSISHFAHTIFSRISIEWEFDKRRRCGKRKRNFVCVGESFERCRDFSSETTKAIKFSYLYINRTLKRAEGGASAKETFWGFFLIRSLAQRTAAMHWCDPGKTHTRRISVQKLSYVNMKEEFWVFRNIFHIYRQDRALSGWKIVRRKSFQGAANSTIFKLQNSFSPCSICLRM